MAKGAATSTAQAGEPARNARHPAGAGHSRADRGWARAAGRARCSPARCSRRASICGSGAKAYRVRASFLPGPRVDGGRQARRPRSCTRSTSTQRRGARDRLRLHRAAAGEPGAAGATWRPPANPKSSTGRLDVFTRVITDGADAFDQVPAGYHGPLYAEICPQTFPIVVRAGLAAQPDPLPRGARARPTTLDLRRLQRARAAGIGRARRHRAAASRSRSTSPATATALIGYRAKRHTGLVDVDAAGRATESDDFWEPIRRRQDSALILDPDQFYILASKEAVHVPPTHAAEMVPFNPLVGEFRVHYAGFFDPGFGHAAAGGARRRRRCWRCAATRCRSCWRTARSSGG